VSAPPDVVYITKMADHNPELRHSLRSLKNVPHSGVWMSGYRPKWVSHDVGHINIQQRKNKYESAEANLRAACAHPEVSERFYLFNDDFFVMQPVDEIPMLHMGSVDDWVDYYVNAGSNRYVLGLRGTIDLMRDRLHVREPYLFYGIHIPMPIEKSKMAEVLAAADAHRRDIICLHKRTLYGNYWRVGGRLSRDFKVMGTSQAYTDKPFISTTDSAFDHHLVGRHIRRTFPSKSPYER